MTHAEVHEKLTGAFRNVRDGAELTMGETTASEIEGRDSLARVSLGVAGERPLVARFTTKERQALVNVRLIESRRK